MRGLEEDKAVERAVRYLVRSFESSGDNPKPVILHSVRVGMDLYDRGYETHVVIAGVLHDLLEDTGVTPEELRSEFGATVADIVAAASFDESIEDYSERHYDIYRRCFEVGRDAVVVKAADILDNSDYYGLADSAELQRNQLDKMSYFIDESEPYIGDEEIHRELEAKYRAVKRTLNEGTGE
mgnify:CR=1 FL=1